MNHRWQSLAIAAALLVGGKSLQADALCAKERVRSREAALRINREWPQRPSGDELSRYIQALGERLGRIPAAGSAIPWRFTVLRDHSPYAFAIGSGFVYIADGALSFARNESELAAILAHEIGHQLAGHFCEQNQSDSGVSDDSIKRRNSVGTLVQVMDPKKEQEADQYALGLLREAGFDPRAMLEVAKRLPSHGGSGATPTDHARLLAIEHRLKDSRLLKPEIKSSNEFLRLKAAAAR